MVRRMTVSGVAGPPARRRLGEILLTRRKITPEQLDEALLRQRETRGRLGELLVKRGTITGSELTDALVEQLGALEPLPSPGEPGGMLAGMARRLRVPPGARLPDLSLALHRRAHRAATRRHTAGGVPPTDVWTTAELADLRAELNHTNRLLVAQAREIAGLRARVSELERPPAPENGQPEAGPPERAGLRESLTFLLFVPGGRRGGYALVERDGQPPAAGQPVEVGGRRFTVTRVGRSPLPGDGRVCAYVS
jgi:hypothetical protein